MLCVPLGAYRCEKVQAQQSQKGIEQKQTFRKKTFFALGDRRSISAVSKIFVSASCYGGMADMDVFEFAAMIEETPIRTRVIEYTENGQLLAVALTDLIEDGLSMVTPFTNPNPPISLSEPI